MPQMRPAARILPPLASRTLDPRHWRVTAAFRLSLFYAGYFLGTGVSLPFWPVWLAGRGLGAPEIGALLALSKWIGVLANPVLGLLADRSRDRTRFMVLLGGVAVAGYLLCLPAHGFAALVVPSLLISVGMTALVPLADATTLAAAARGKLDYGRVRLWGTFAFIVATVLGGRILSGRSSELVLYLLLGGMVMIAFCCALVPRAAAAPMAAASPWRWLMTRRHLVFLAAATLVQSSHAVYYAFGTLYWQRIGFSDSTIAWLWAEGAIAELVLFYGGARFVIRWRPGLLLALGGAAGIVRWTLTAVVTSLPALVLIQPLHALTFAAAHWGAMRYLAAEMPPARAGTAQSVYNASVNGLGLGFASLAAGVLYDAWGGGAYLGMAAMAGAGAAIAARLK
jgi:MFS transporter, PPP family, 3-phenylpropionic acid transporter